MVDPARPELFFHRPVVSNITPLLKNRVNMRMGQIRKRVRKNEVGYEKDATGPTVTKRIVFDRLVSYYVYPNLCVGRAAEKNKQ